MRVVGYEKLGAISFTLILRGVEPVPAELAAVKV
jgi:hypothetical protein